MQTYYAHITLNANHNYKQLDPRIKFEAPDNKTAWETARKICINTPNAIAYSVCYSKTGYKIVPKN